MTEAVIRKKPGMASVKDMPVLQDGPPPGGFAPVRYARRIPNKGPSSVAIFLAAFGTFSWGMYQVGKGNKIRRALKEEKYAARRAILPVLQAEEDERYVKEWKKYLEYEAEVMKDVPNWKVGESVYNSGKWMPPATGELRPETSLSFVTFVLASLTISTFAATSSPTLAEKVTNRHYEIHIINGFIDSDKPLIIHCLSKDGYLGVHTFGRIKSTIGISESALEEHSLLLRLGMGFIAATF
ncbi:hypothetical protein ACFX13_013118 [Malus domestica]|uniref:NADH dehydrogenase [ubiquinone] 1 alpha subcomplex subunit 13 n=1 Tax=Malus domestica TaxID=3750 RepID=A0A498I904_MALDO|nr:hypothetical protein DVH24_001985 [Malus domestica]